MQCVPLFGYGNMKNIKIFVLPKLIFLLVVCFGTSVSSAQLLINQPAVPNSFIRSGEVLEYSVKIRGIPAGNQMIQINAEKSLDGNEVYHVKSISKVRKLFNILYPFSNHSESIIQSESFHPLRYTKKIRDGGYKGDIKVDFDWDNQVARIVKDNKHTEISVPQGVQDELSMIYLLRSKELQVGQEYEFPFLTGNKTLKTTVYVLRTERIKTILGSLDTIVIKTKPKDIIIWFTNDAARIPVKIEARTKIGKLVSKLKSVH